MHRHQLKKLILIVGPLSVLLAAIYIGILLGVEEKAWWEKAWGFVAGGSLGAMAGIGFFALVGAIGWVSGPVFGAIGLFGLVTGGALGGMGLGSLVDLIRNPDDYNVNHLTLLAAATIGTIAAFGLRVLLHRRFSNGEGPQSTN
ncbi:MAG: hypothetical protein R3E34_07005 [Rhodocyclaceae bacterium]